MIIVNQVQNQLNQIYIKYIFKIKMMKIIIQLKFLEKKNIINNEQLNYDKILNDINKNIIYEDIKNNLSEFNNNIIENQKLNYEDILNEFKNIKYEENKFDKVNYYNTIDINNMNYY